MIRFNPAVEEDLKPLTIANEERVKTEFHNWVRLRRNCL